MVKKMKMIVTACLLGVVVIVIGGFVLNKSLHSNDSRVTTVTESSLEKVLEISDLSTLDYTYNSIVDVLDEDGETVKYHVAYEGVVTAGIDFESVDVSVDEETKMITITVPEAVVQNVDVDMGTLEYIFEEKKYETETVSQEAYKACRADLEKKAMEEGHLLATAKENAVDAVNALMTPWIEQLDEAYQVEVK